MAEDFTFDDLRPRTWLDAFPWLQGTQAALIDSPWWDEPIDEAGTVARRRRLADISELAMQRVTRWTIGQIFPGLSPDTVLDDLQMPTRAINAVSNRGYRYAGDLAGLQLDEIIAWRQVGASTVHAILQALADASTSIATPSVLTAGPTGSRSAPQTDQVRMQSWISSVVDDLTQLATWHTTVGLLDRRLLGAELASGTPEEIIKVRQRLESLTASDVLEKDTLDLDVAQLLDEVLSVLDTRAVRILAVRLFADQPTTLDQLGKEFGVTRERVRQIEGKARGAMLGAVRENHMLGMAAAAARNLIGTVLPLSDLLALMPALSRTVERVGQPAWRVLDRLDDAYEIEDGWCTVPTFTQARSITVTQLQELADPYGVVRIEDVNVVQSSQPERVDELTRQWLSRCGCKLYNGFVFTRTQSVGDYAASVLSATGSPLSVQEILDCFTIERSVSSLKNAMAADARFERVDRDRWALAEWGMDAYVGIRSLIREQIARNRGQIELEALIEHITGKYSVTASSVITTASAPPFEARAGIVRLAGMHREVRKTPERTRGLFRRNHAWGYRIKISGEHLRGSGSMAPVAIASILNLQPGESRCLESPLGQQSVSWAGPQPTFGTIRRFLMEYDVAADTEVFLVVGDDGTFNFEVVPDLSGASLPDALTLIGADPNLVGPAAREALTTAIGLRADSPTASIIGGYRERGDTDIADLLTDARDLLETDPPVERSAPSTDVDQILDLL